MSLVVICCHSLSLVVTCCTTRYHLLYYSLSLVVIHCATRCDFLSLGVIRCTNRCHSLSLVVPLVASWCTTRLSFYKRSLFWISTELVLFFNLDIKNGYYKKYSLFVWTSFSKFPLAGKKHEIKENGFHWMENPFRPEQNVSQIICFH